MKSRHRLIQKTAFGWLVVGLLMGASCEKPETETSCFTKSSLEKTVWIKNHLAGFQRPKAGPLRVVVYSYQNQAYLAFENLYLSAPMANVFNCSGLRLTELKIDYNQFKQQAKEVDVLLEGTY